MSSSRHSPAGTRHKHDSCEAPGPTLLSAAAVKTAAASAKMMLAGTSDLWMPARAKLGDEPVVQGGDRRKRRGHHRLPLHELMMGSQQTNDLEPKWPWLMVMIMMMVMVMMVVVMMMIDNNAK